jgi:hypothetical protein
MEKESFDSFNPSEPEGLSLEGMDMLADIDDNERFCSPDPSRSAIITPAECTRIPEYIRRIRSTDNPFDISE